MSASTRLFARFLQPTTLVLAVLALSACASMPQRQISELKRPVGGTKIVLMPLDVQLTELTAGGVEEPRADWTAEAKHFLGEAFTAEQKARGLQFTAFDEAKLSPAVADQLNQIQRLHAAVGATIMQNDVPGTALPTQQGKFDWTLGPAVKAMKDVTGADYVLFTHLHDSYSSSGRIALMVAASLFGVGVHGGAQVGFASLVDLQTGNVVWFCRLARNAGDLRTAPGAADTAELLLTDFPK